ncbi:MULTISPECIES: VOC family protein [Mumia]|uniref:Aldoketomutase n=1 Tax=Mumia xiangluensis TaxID=1678900 RepID=A0ABW1QS85_9ACTN|nr:MULTISPECIES: VOC family protein [Mumia]
MEHRRSARLALVAAVLSVSVACAGSDDDPAGARTPSPTAVTEAATADATDRTSVGAAGIGVADLRASSQFYRSAFGMVELRAFEIPGYMDEIVLGFDDMTRGAAVVLMHYTDGRERDYQDNPVKLVFYVPDPTATARAIEAAGGSIVLEPAPQAALDDAVVGLAKDPDGYTLELLEAGGGTGG